MKIAPPQKLNCYILFCVISLFGCLILPNSSHAFFGGKIDKFTADQVEISPEGTITNTIKLYVTPTAVRMDGIPGAGMNPNMPMKNLSMFTFKDKDQHYIFNHDKKLYYQMTLDDKEMSLALKDYKNAQQVNVLGKEKVSGYKCVKKEVTSTTTVFGMTNTSKMIIWESDRFEMPLRTQSPDGHLSEMRNIDTGAPSSSVFKLPQGYKKVDNMMMAMGMDFSKMGDDDSDVEPVSNKGNTKKGGAFKMSEIKKENIEKTIQGLGNKLKNFKFGD